MKLDGRGAWLALLCAALIFFAGCVQPAVLASAQPEKTVPAGAASAPENTPAPTATPALEMATEPTATPAPTPFSIVWMSDTQHYSDAYPEVFDSMTQWVADNAERLNLVYVVHTGDVVQTSRVERQWQNAVAALDTLWQADIPLFVTAGNHDVAASRRDYTAYKTHIAARDEHVEYEGGKGSYTLFSAGGTDFILIGMGCYCIREQAALDFLNMNLESVPERVAILCTHSYMHKTGKLGGEGPKYYSGVVRKNPNVRLVLAGNMRGVGRSVAELDDDGDGVADRTVNQMLANYQDSKQRGYLRILTFDPLTRDISVTTYSPWLEDYNAFDDGRDEFILKDAF